MGGGAQAGWVGAHKASHSVSQSVSQGAPAVHRKCPEFSDQGGAVQMLPGHGVIAQRDLGHPGQSPLGHDVLDFGQLADPVVGQE